ncbi:uncharacterized protein LOC128549130 [Mercenaria mercenaria]|uniref:uncharacterized protein LOC128549130 n=1 Tax=Mercenaria mercenaria TaxID=6596 RepID=UPI00234F90BB|nr:uncharacterized protein LOC128549130 [Mercenaria mercenaria]XP_053381424.1 uncharacterized protein LOC128549130 [Mercenaria mercenaria]
MEDHSSDGKLLIDRSTSYHDNEAFTGTPEPILNSATGDVSREPEKGCARFSEKVKIKVMNDLKPGDHVCFDGRMFRKRIVGDQKALYQHHAIVSSITIMGSQMAVLHLIEVSKDKGQVVENRYALDLKHTHVYKVEYHCKFTNSRTLQAAKEKINTKWEYSILKNNCEHFCNECCVGDKKSIQAETCFYKCPYVGCCVIGMPSLIRSILLIVFLTADDIINDTLLLNYDISLGLDIAFSIGLNVLFFVMFTLINNCCCESNSCYVCREEKCKTCKRYDIKRCVSFFIIWFILQCGSSVFVVVSIHIKLFHRWWVPIAIGIAVNFLTMILLWRVLNCCIHPVRKKNSGDKP